VNGADTNAPATSIWDPSLASVLTPVVTLNSASMSSTHGSDYPANALNTNTNYARTNSGSNNQWWKANFASGAETAITRVEVTFNSGNAGRMPGVLVYITNSGGTDQLCGTLEVSHNY
jgi:hypothetical protein